MKQISALAFAAVLALFIAASFSFGAGRADDEVSPIIGVIPTGYRQWELIAPAQEAEPLNELRSVLGIPTLLPIAIPSLPDVADRNAYDAARQKLMPNLSGYRHSAMGIHAAL
jgi:hypothetical protein